MANPKASPPNEYITRLFCVHLSELGLKNPKLEHKFHKVRNWLFDIAFPEQMLAIEIDGWGHRTHKRFLEDIDKLNHARALGWTVFRVTPNQVKKGIAKEMIKELLEVYYAD